MAEIAAVQLTDQEQALHDSICWDLNQLIRKDFAERIEHLEKMAHLAESLLERDAIPEIRRAYFTDPEMNVGGYGKSRKEVFEKNGTSGRDILRHPHFMAYLRYFIHGPHLPDATIRGFSKIIEDDAGTSGMVLDQIRAFVRKEVRDKGLNPNHVADEFLKLAYEIGRPDLAESVRAAAKQVRK